MDTAVTEIVASHLSTFLGVNSHFLERYVSSILHSTELLACFGVMGYTAMHELCVGSLLVVVVVISGDIVHHSWY